MHIGSHEVRSEIIYFGLANYLRAFAYHRALLEEDGRRHDLGGLVLVLHLREHIASTVVVVAHVRSDHFRHLCAALHLESALRSLSGDLKVGFEENA